MLAFLQNAADATNAAAAGAAMPWDIVTKITTPLMLLALVVVAFYALRSQSISAETERLQQVPQDDRLELADKLADKYGVPVKDLSADDRVGIVKQELALRREQQRRISWLFFGGFVIAGVLSLSGFIITKRAANGEDVLSGTDPVTHQDSLVLRRENPSVGFPGTICLGNPAMPPSDGCVALLGGSRTQQNLVFDLGPQAADARLVDAVLHLTGLSENSAAPKPTCLQVHLDDKTVSDAVPLKLDPITISDRLSDESELNTVAVTFSKSARKLLRATGRHRVTISIPNECVGPGLVAFRDAQLIVRWQ